jgi:hypothetical protein
MGVIQDMYLDDTHKGREVFSEVPKASTKVREKTRGEIARGGDQ